MILINTKIFFITVHLFQILCIHCNDAKTNSKSTVVEDIVEFKDFKKLLRTKTNVLVMFVASARKPHSEIKVFRDAASVVKGIGTMVMIDCSLQDRKKLCKKLKVSPLPYILKHYKDGDFHKDYERQISVSAIVNFMRDPTGDLPWQEDPAGADVLHFADYASFSKVLKREIRPILVMFYVPWCGYCKRLKPDFSKAATELKDKGYIMAAMNVETTENAPARKAFNITGFPTLLYFQNGQLRQTYGGENNKDALVAFMQNPSAVAARKPKETDWSEDPDSEVVHLTTRGFEPAINDEQSVLVMFYAPWCGHCKRMKPEYERAALLMKERRVPGVLAALDATKETSIAERFKVKGFPTLKYFVNGVYKFDVNVREADKIIDFMQNPQEPPPPPPPELPWEEEKDSEILFLNEENFSATLKRKKHALVLFYAPWCGHCKNVKPEFKAAAEALKDDARIIFAAVDCTRQTSVCQTYDVRGYPTIKYFSYLKTKIDYTGARKQQDFINFMSSPIAAVDDAGKTTPERFGDYPGTGNILMLSDNNFEEQLQQFQRVLVLFYAPWCGHCKDLKPLYAAAAERTIGSNRLAAIDCSFYKRVAKSYNIEALPTLLLFERGVQKSTYMGGRNTEDILKFLAGKETSSSNGYNNTRDEL